tara:strand:+ start:5264 stop:7567 length:2304 start_codon:yes stop_codon:yes gene_type:complete
MSTRNNIPYLDIINQFEAACSASVSVATFDTGTIDFLDANAVNKNYPYIYLRPISSAGVVDKVRNLTFELYSLDVPKLSDQSPVKVLSTTEQRIYELISWFNFGPPDLQQVYEITINDLSPVNEAFQDRVFGWVATIEVATPWQWNYCDYPRSDWPTATPPPTASPTPIPTSTATPTPTGPTPTPSTSPTATPIVPTSTATPVPFPTPPPSPTPSPTAAPPNFEFLMSDTNRTGSLIEVCDTIDVPNTTVYTRWFDEDLAFPDRIVGKTIYSNPGLTQIYTGSAVNDTTVGRIALSASLYAGLDLRWSIGTSSNQVLDVQACDYPRIDTLPDTPQTPTSTLLRGQVENYGEFNLDEFYFFWGTGSAASDLTNVVTASYADANSLFTGSIGGLTPDEVYYYRAAARDTTANRLWYGDIEEFRPVLPYSREVQVGMPASHWWHEQTTTIESSGVDVFGGDTSAFFKYGGFTQTGSFYITAECDSSTNQIEPYNFLNSYLWEDENISIQKTGSNLFGLTLTGGQDTAWLPYSYTTGSTLEQGYFEVNNIGSGYVIQRVIPTNDINGFSLNWSEEPIRTYTTLDPNFKYNGPRKADICTPIADRPSDTNLPTGSNTWGYIWIEEDADGYFSSTEACTRWNSYNGSPSSYPGVSGNINAMFGYMSSSAAHNADPGEGLRATQSYLYYEPYYQESSRIVQYSPDNDPGDESRYILGWSGSLRPAGPDGSGVGNIPDTIYKVGEAFKQRNPNGSGDDIWLYIQQKYPANQFCNP